MTFNPTSSSSKQNIDSTDLEHKMRRTLGIDAPSQGYRRRFAQDGDVPVIVRGRRDTDRDVVETELRKEQECRQRAERLLAAAQATIRDLQTKHAHAEMALAETREPVHRAEERAQGLDTALAEQKAAVELLKQSLAKQVAAQELIKRPFKDVLHRNRSTSVAEMQRRRPDPRFREGQEPIDWWSKHKKKK